jgi:hypothetical protein
MDIMPFINQFITYLDNVTDNSEFQALVKKFLSDADNDLRAGEILYKKQIFPLSRAR